MHVIFKKKNTSAKVDAQTFTRTNENKAEAIVWADCKAGHSVLIPLSGLLLTECWPFLAILIDMAVEDQKTVST